MPTLGRPKHPTNPSSLAVPRTADNFEDPEDDGRGDTATSGDSEDNTRQEDGETWAAHNQPPGPPDRSTTTRRERTMAQHPPTRRREPALHQALHQLE